MSEFITSVLQFLADLGYFGVALGLMIEVIPSEIVLSWAGYLVAGRELTFVGAVIAGTIGGTLAQMFLYWLGRYGGRPMVVRFGKYLLIRAKHIDQAEAWFNRYGTIVIFTARFIPVVRHAISIPAGLAKMSLIRFTLYTTLAVIPWSVLFVRIGFTLGENWRSFDEKAAPFVMPAIWTAVVVTIAYFVWRWVRDRRHKNGANN